MKHKKTQTGFRKNPVTLAMIFSVAIFAGSVLNVAIVNAGITGCTITQNGADVKDNPQNSTPAKKAVRGKEIAISFGVTVTPSQTYTSFDWTEVADGVKQNPLSVLTTLANGALNAGSQKVFYSNTYAATDNQVKYTMVIHYQTTSGPNVTKHTWSDSCSVSYKDHIFDPDKSKATATTPANGKSTVTATIVDGYGIPFANTSVNLYAIPSESAGKPTYSPAVAKTNSFGVATIVVSSKYSGKDVYDVGVPDLDIGLYGDTYGHITKELTITWPAAPLTFSNGGLQATPSVGNTYIAPTGPASATSGGSSQPVAPSTTPSSPIPASGSGTTTPPDDSSSSPDNSSSSPDNSSSGTDNQSTIISPNTSSGNSSNSSSDNSNAVAAADSGSTGNTDSGTVTLQPSQDIISCRQISAKVLYFQDGQPAYDRISLTCALTKDALVNAAIYNKSYDPKAADNSANLVKTVKPFMLKKAGTFAFTWDGYDETDLAAPLSDEKDATDVYNFVVNAKLDDTYMPDISIQKFKVENVPAPTTNGTSTTTSTSTDTSGATSTTTTTTSTSTDLHGAAPAVAPTPSKCPGVNYPTDIDNSPVKDLILKAYDLCFIQGYQDGTFKGTQNITRAESTKIAILAAGKIAEQGCYDADCGSPFMDLDMWQGPWLRAAWDLKMVVGVSPSQFAPNRSITKAESASLIDRALKIAPHTGCYNASCGAGYPDDIFLDVINFWEGPYLRALWDRHAVESVQPHKFYPDIAITREQFIEILMKARGTDTGPTTPAASDTTTSTSTTTTTAP